MNMEASRWWLHLAKAGDLEVVVACADIAERERDRIGSSMGGRVSGRRGRRAIRRRPVVHRRVSRRGRGGGGIHRCGSLRADDCGLIDRRRAVFSSVQLGRSTVKPRASAPTRETYKGRLLASQDPELTQIHMRELGSLVSSLAVGVLPPKMESSR